MTRSIRRAAQVALALLFACIATPHLASAQWSDDEQYDEPSDPAADMFDSAPAQEPAPPINEALGIPADSVAFALAQSPSGATTPASSVPVRFVAIDNRLEVHQDGSSTATSHIEMQLLSQAAVNALAQPALAYSDSLQTLDIKNAYTLKRDGSKIPVSPAGIITRQKSMPEPYFTDQKEKVILFPNVEAGDTLVYDSVIQSSPSVPGQFYFGTSLPRLVEIDSDTITFVAPKSLPLNFDIHGIELQKGSEGDNLTYTLHFVNRNPIVELPQYLPDVEHGTRIFASTATSFDAIAASYAPLALSKVEVTPKIQAEADAITAGVSDHREQARRIYDWVSGHIRYIALIFGDGGIVPHDADSILTNAFGDCKDHAVLYSALLKAKGIPSELVVINATNGYSLPNVPELLTFNHMIVWIPEFGVYADTTSDLTSFGVLPQLEYGKPVIHLGRGQGALRHTPLLREADSTYSSSTTMRFDADGKLSAHQSVTASGALTSVLRNVANVVTQKGSSAVAGALLRARKLDAIAGSYSFPSSGALTPQFAYSSTYQSAHALVGDASFAPSEGLNIVDGYSPALLGPAADSRFRTADTVPCFSGTLSDDYTLELPADKKVASLPQDTNIVTSNLSYRAHWSLAGKTVTLHRELHAHFATALCTGDALRETRVAIARIRQDYETRIAVTSARAS